MKLTVVVPSPPALKSRSKLTTKTGPVPTLTILIRQEKLLMKQESKTTQVKSSFDKLGRKVVPFTLEEAEAAAGLIIVNRKSRLEIRRRQWLKERKPLRSKQIQALESHVQEIERSHEEFIRLKREIHAFRSMTPKNVYVCQQP